MNAFIKRHKRKIVHLYNMASNEVYDKVTRLLGYEDGHDCGAILDVLHWADPYSKSFGVFRKPNGINYGAHLRAAGPKGYWVTNDRLVIGCIIRDGFLYQLKVPVKYVGPEYVIEHEMKRLAGDLKQILEYHHHQMYGMLYEDDSIPDPEVTYW